MPRRPSSRADHRRNARPQAQRRRRPRSSRRRPQAPRARLPHHQSPLRPVTDASASTNDLDAQEPEAEENLINIPEDATTAAAPENETRQSRAYFVTLRKVGFTSMYHCQIEQRSVASSGERLLRSVSEDALVLDQWTTTSVSFALVDGDPIAATKRVMDRLVWGVGFVDGENRIEVLDESMRSFWLEEFGYEVDSTPTL